MIVGDPLEYPATAQRFGVSGWARLRCITQSDASVRDCQVVGEAPRGLLFASTAMRATSRLRAKLEGPALEAIVGKPSYYMVRFGDRRRSAGEVVKGASVARIEAARPSGAEPVGMAELTCSPPISGKGLVADCVVKNEGPAGQGFGGAAVGLAQAEYTVDIEPAPTRIDFRLTPDSFSNRKSRFAATPDVISFASLVWRDPPERQDGAAFPSEGVPLNCAVGQDGSLSDCRSAAKPKDAQRALAFVPRLVLDRSVGLIINWGQCDWPMACALKP